jgi:hypothetical protein
MPVAKNPTEDANVFALETNFQKLARRPGALTRQEAIEKARKRLEEIEPSFEEWLDSELKQISAAVQRIQDNITDRENIETATFHCCQVRDIGTTMRCELITFIAGCLCDVLESIATGAECDMESVRCHVDSLLLARQQQYRHLKPEQVPELTAGLRRVVEHVGTGPTDGT